MNSLDEINGIDQHYPFNNVQHLPLMLQIQKEAKFSYSFNTFVPQTLNKDMHHLVLITLATFTSLI